MRKIREVLRLYFAAALSIRAIARSVGTSPSTVADYLRRAEGAGLSWPVPEAIDDVGLERRLFPALPPSGPSRPLPAWSEVHRELRRKGVTLSLLWQEYKALHPEGLQYSWFCGQYRAWAGKLDLVMRQEHRAGEKLFVDYAGQTVPVVDPETGEVREAQVFVAVLGASSYTFAEATWTQTLPDWTASHVRAFDFFGGCPELVIPDNLRSGVSRADRYEPDLNPSYHDLARHYGVAVLPARVRRPRDKAKAEVAVQVVERWILAALRHRRFFSLAELNAAIAKLLERLNTRPGRPLVRGTARAARRPRTHRAPLATAHQPAATSPAQARRLHRGHRRPAPSRARQATGPLARRRTLGPRASQRPDLRANRRGQKLDSVRPRPRRLPQRTQRVVPPRVPAAECAGHCASRRTLPEAARVARQDRRARDRRLGADPLQRREPSRPA